MAYTVTPFRPDAHREALASLWAENLSDARIGAVIADRMRWLYEDGPERRATTILCVDEASGAVVGCGSFFHRATWIDGHRTRTGVLCDFAVMRAHRVAGAALAIQRALIESAGAAGVELLYGHPNDKSLAVFKRIGYQVVGETSAWAKPLLSEPMLRDVLRVRDAARIAAVPVDAALRAFDRLRGAGAPPGLRGEVLPRADERVEALWRRARAQYAIVGEQSPDYLEWRYRRFTTSECGLFGLLHTDDRRLVALAAWSWNGRRVTLCDLFGDHLESCAEPLLLQLSAHLRAQGAESVSLSYLGSASFGTQLLSVGFVPRSGRRPLVVYPVGLGDAARRRVLDAASWFMLEGELDI